MSKELDGLILKSKVKFANEYLNEVYKTRGVVYFSDIMDIISDDMNAKGVIPLVTDSVTCMDRLGKIIPERYHDREFVGFR